MPCVKHVGEGRPAVPLLLPHNYRVAHAYSGIWERALQAIMHPFVAQNFVLRSQTMSSVFAPLHEKRSFVKPKCTAYTIQMKRIK